VLALAEEKRRDVGRAEIIELLGVKQKAADKVTESLRRKGWLERASWGEYMVIPPEQGSDVLGESNLFASASRIADPYYIGFKPWSGITRMQESTQSMPLKSRDTGSRSGARGLRSRLWAIRLGHRRLPGTSISVSGRRRASRLLPARHSGRSRALPG
jgi:hypothetical protein